VWRAVTLEMGVMLGLVAVILIGVVIGFLRNVPSRNWGGIMILVPLGTYLWFSVRGEQQAERPREGLLTVSLFSALLANGVGLPLVEGFFAPREWLSEAGFFTRALGYAFTFGVTSEFLKYIAIRYTVWPRRVRIRMDGIAYSVAASVGYATVLNIQVVLQEEPTVSVLTIRIAINFITQIGFGVIMGYFMSEMAVVPNRSPWYLASGLFIAALINGLFIGFRGIAVSSGFNVRSLNGLILAIFFALFVMLTINFLIESADQRAADLAGIRRIR
ncbi:MAG TPA: hypothetical protein VJZ27_14525, partial [Aggregatilineales bacterium]|nr:hypothetical protein [Aggregatilineales bacterium]